MKGTRFKDIRIQLDLSQEDLADILGLSGKQAVSNIERGRSNPSKLSLALMEAFIFLSQPRSRELQNFFREQFKSGQKKRKSNL